MAIPDDDIRCAAEGTDQGVDRIIVLNCVVWTASKEDRLEFAASIGVGVRFELIQGSARPGKAS